MKSNTNQNTKVITYTNTQKNIKPNEQKKSQTTSLMTLLDMTVMTRATSPGKVS